MHFHTECDVIDADTYLRRYSGRQPEKIDAVTWVNLEDIAYGG